MKFFSPLRGTNSYTTHDLLSFFFSSIGALKGTAKAPAVDLFSPKRHQFLYYTLFPVIVFRRNTLKGTAKAPAVDLFSPKRHQFLYGTLFPIIFFRRNTLKGTAKAPAVDLFRLTTLRSTKTAFWTLKRYHEHPCPFYMGVPLPPGLFPLS